MPKRRQDGRACLSEPVRMDALLSHVLRDASRYIDVDVLAATLVTDSSQFRSKVSSSLSSAALHLDEGRFQQYAVLRQIDALIKKNVSFFAKSAEERHRAAFVKFVSSERKCKRTNARLAFYASHWSRAPLSFQILNEAKSIIFDLLGEVDLETYNEVLEHACFGSGTTFCEEGSGDTSYYARLTKGHTITAGALGLLKDYRDTSNIGGRYIASQSVKIVRGDRVAFVPKNWDVDRTIAIQPSLNVFFQKGVDLVLKRKLRKVGIDLSDQTLNHIPAGIGSVDGTYCTVDLSSASDTVSNGIVQFLFPRSWLTLLSALRAEEYTTDKGRSWTPYEKFSSMGNAFTFPIETIIFWAIAKACCARCNVSTSMLQVYGDDIVIDRAAYLIFREALQFAGFEVNAEKSFAFSTFRETCGCDFVYGVDVRPVYLKKVPSSVGEVYSLHNRLLCNRLGLQFPSTLAYLQGLVLKPHYGPYFQGSDDWYIGKDTIFDGYFIGDPPPGRWNLEWQTRVYDVTCLSRRQKTTLLPYSEVRHYLAFLLGMSSDRIESSDRHCIFTRKYVTSRWPTMSEVATLLDRDRRRLRDVW